jgi:hypothetical protein
MASEHWKEKRSQLYRQMIKGAAALTVLREVSIDSGYDRIHRTAEMLAERLTTNQAEKLLGYEERLSDSKMDMEALFEKLGPEEVFSQAFDTDFAITDLHLAPYGADFKISRADFEDLYGTNYGGFSAVLYTNGERIVSKGKLEEEALVVYHAAQDADASGPAEFNDYCAHMIRVGDAAHIEYMSGYRRILFSIGIKEPDTADVRVEPSAEQDQIAEAFGEIRKQVMERMSYNTRIHELSHNFDSTIGLFEKPDDSVESGNPETDNHMYGIFSMYPSLDIVMVKNTLMTETIAALEAGPKGSYSIFGHSILENVAIDYQDFDKHVSVALGRYRENAEELYSSQLESREKRLARLEELDAPIQVIHNEKRLIADIKGQKDRAEPSLANIGKSYAQLNETRKSNIASVEKAQEHIPNVELAYLLRTMDFDNVYKRLPEVASRYSKCSGVRPKYAQEFFDEHGVSVFRGRPMGAMKGNLHTRYGQDESLMQDIQ